MSSYMDHLKCPICFEIPEGKVFQCKNGHTFCSQCSPRLKTCPQCRVLFGSERIRNRTLEHILDATRFACPNKELGCARVLGRAEISSHLLYCRFEPFYFCKLIGFQSCSYDAVHSLQHGNSHNLIAHLKQAHPEIQQTVVDLFSAEQAGNYWIHLNYERFLSRANKLEKGAVAIWTPHLIKVNHREKNYSSSSNSDDDDGGGGTLLLVLCQISELTRNAAWICLCMTTDTVLTDDQYQENSEFDVSKKANAVTATYHHHQPDSNTTTFSTFNAIDITSSSVIQYQLKGQVMGCDDNKLKIKNNSDQCQQDEPNLLLVPKMKWKAPLLTFQNIDKELEKYALRVPICVLNSFSSDSGDLEIGIKLRDGGMETKGKGISQQQQHRLLPASSNGAYARISELTSFVTNTTLQLLKPQYCCPAYRGNTNSNHGSSSRDNRNENEDQQQSPVVFEHIYCNGCGQRPLVNIRYKCLQCIDYDLCKECMDRGDTHMHHVFARIHSQRQNELFNWKHRSSFFKDAQGKILLYLT